MLCDLFGWFCEQHGEAVSHAAPEINAAVCVSALVLVLGAVVILRRRVGRP